MRIIKFRGKVEYPQKYFGDKDILNGRWIVGDLHLNWCYPHIHIDTKDKYPINPNTIGQFTGLHDKNGKEIYEGDIIRSFDSKGEPIIHHIIYDDEEAGFVAALKGSAKGDFGYGRFCQQWITEWEKEVIGNIHDDLGLLKTTN